MKETAELKDERISEERNYSLEWLREKIMESGLDAKSYFRIFGGYKSRLSHAYDEVWNVFTRSQERAEELKHSGITKDVLLLYKLGMAAFGEDPEMEIYFHRNFLRDVHWIVSVDESLLSHLSLSTEYDEELFGNEGKKRVEGFLEEMRMLA